MKHIISLEHVSYAYQNHPVLTDISLTINEGEKVALLGANGSGKSTLLKLLDALLFPTQGIYWAFSQEINPLFLSTPDHEYAFRRNVGFVFQDSDVQLFSPTVWDEVMFAPLQMGYSKEQIIRKATNALNMLGIKHLKDRVPFELSGGEKKKVAIASVLSYEPRVWLFDEPTAGLDPKSQSKLIDFIFRMNKMKNTVITATHDLAVLPDICERVIVLSDHHTIVADDSPKAILKNTRLLIENNLIHEHLHTHRGKIHKHRHTHTSGHLHD